MGGGGGQKRGDGGSGSSGGISVNFLIASVFLSKIGNKAL